jgi:hypothetical protein
MQRRFNFHDTTYPAFRVWQFNLTNRSRWKSTVLFIMVLLSGMMLPSKILVAQAPPQGGGFGHFQIGFNLNHFPVLNDYLKNPDILGNSYSPSREGIQLGGGGYGVLGRLLLGGSGYFSGFNPIQTDSASVSLSSGTALFNAGYLLKKTERWLIFPYAGVGGTGLSLRLANRQDSGGIFFDRNQGISFGEISKLSLGGIASEVGISFKYFITTCTEDSPHGALMIGFDLGCQASFFTSNKWSDGKGRTLTGPNSLSGYLPYIRITLGGGGIW